MSGQNESPQERKSRTGYLHAKFYGEMSSESVDQIIGLFRLLDADASGQLEVGEFITSAASLGFEGSQAELAAQLQDFGKSGDDVLTDEEFIRFVGNLINKDKPKCASQPRRTDCDSMSSQVEQKPSGNSGIWNMAAARPVGVTEGASEDERDCSFIAQRESLDSSAIGVHKKSNTNLISSGAELEERLRILENTNKELVKQKGHLAEEKTNLKSEVERLTSTVQNLADQLDNQGGNMEDSIARARTMDVESEACKRDAAKWRARCDEAGGIRDQESQFALDSAQSLTDARAKNAHFENLCAVTAASLERANEEKVILEQRCAGYKFKYAIQMSMMSKKYRNAILERTEAEESNQARIRNVFGLDRKSSMSLDMTDPTDVVRFERSVMIDQVEKMNTRLRKAQARIYSLEMCALKMHAPDLDVEEIRERLLRLADTEIPVTLSPEVEQTKGSDVQSQTHQSIRTPSQSLVSPRQSVTSSRQMVQSIRSSIVGTDNTALLMETLEQLELVIVDKENAERGASELEIQLQHYKARCEELEAESHNTDKAALERRRNSQLQREELEEELQALREKVNNAEEAIRLDREQPDASSGPNEQGLAFEIANDRIAKLEEELKLAQFECGKLERAAVVNEAYAKKETDWLVEEKEKALEELDGLKNTLRQKETQLQQMVDDLQVETKRLKLQLQESELQIAEGKQTAEQAAQFSEATIARLQGALDEAKGQKQALNSDIENAKQSAQEQVRGLRGEQVNYDNTIERLTKRNKQLDELLSDEKKRSLDAKEKLTAEIAALEQKLQLVKEEKDKLEDEVFQARQLQTNDARRFVGTEDGLKEQVARLVEDKKLTDEELALTKAKAGQHSRDLNTELDDALKKCDSLRKENKQLAQELSSSKRLVSDIQSKLDTARSDLQQLLAREKQRIVDHQEQASLHELRLAQLNLEIRELRRDVAVSERDVDKWRNFHLENVRRMEMLNDGMVRQQKTTTKLKSYM